jgi:2-amino-4-hydroxy-6-hydroxymethyldihydropteridine diphosphokinase
MLQEATLYLKNAGFHLVKASSLYEAEPVGFFPDLNEVPWFLNQVLLGEWDVPFRDILALTQGVELQLGRHQKTSFSNGKFNYASRSMDIDILLVGDVIVQEETLELPHPRFHARRYDLVALCEIAPQELHPVFQLSFAELLNRCEALDTVRLYEPS